MVNQDQAREQAMATQQEAVRLATTESMMILTGGPGVGKTHTIQDILFHLEGADVKLAAPTGKAAKRMSEACKGFPASTIHRLLEYSPKFGGFTRNSRRPIDADVIIVDESSMIDISLMHSFMKAVKPATRLIFVGDKDQLPSVGPGNVLKDMIESKKIPTIHLSYIWRQDAHSWIPTNAARINAGKGILPVDPQSNDFFVNLIEDKERARHFIVQLITELIPQRTGTSPEHIQLLCPQKRGPLGTDQWTEGKLSLNQEIQNIINPYDYTTSKYKPVAGFRIGDKVINIRNNYDLEVFNGETGIVYDLGPERCVHVDYGDFKATHRDEEVDDLRLAYALTIHKSQGSEWPHVVVPVHSTNSIMLNRNLFYTAVTRARASVTVVADEKGLHRAIKNCAPLNRNTWLAGRLRGEEKAAVINPDAANTPEKEQLIKYIDNEAVSALCDKYVKEHNL